MSRRKRLPPSGPEVCDEVTVDLTPQLSAAQRAWPVGQPIPLDSGVLEDGGVPRVAPWVGSVKSVVKPTPVGNIILENGGEPILPKPFIPTTDELAALPANARAAAVERFERQTGLSRPDLPPAERMRQAVFAIVERSTTGHPIGRILRKLRREFDSLASVARAENWADDTPVPATAFEHRWPVAAPPLTE